MITVAASVIQAGATIAMIAPHARTCFHVSVFVGSPLVGTGMGSGQKGRREGAMLAG